jgi:zinc transport system permease protein
MMQYPFVYRALVGGILIALLSGYYGVFVVQRGLSFMGNGLAHATFGGVALGLLLDIEPLWIAVPFTMLVALGIVWIQLRTKISGDTAIGVFFATSMALGIIFLSMKTAYTQDAFSYLFGSLLAVGMADLAAAFMVLLLTVCLLPMWGRWAYSTFDRELAQADRLNIHRHDYLLAACLAATIVISVKLVGILLIAAFLVIPAATSRLVARSFFGMTMLSILFGLISVVVGMFVSIGWDLPTGPAMVLVQAVIFFVFVIVSGKAR